MFGIKTKIINQGKSYITKFFKGSIANNLQTKILMEKFNVDEYGHRASIKNSDLGYGWIHYSFVRLIKPKNILCVGSRYGYIPSILAQACKDNKMGHVDFVDASYDESSENNWTGVGYWNTELGKQTFIKYGLGKYITTHVETTQDFSKKKTYQYIYIDGDHSYHGVKHDFKKFWKQLSKGGFIVFHDVNVNGKKPEGVYGVNKLWKNISINNSIEFFFEGSGLGIKQKR